MSSKASNVKERKKLSYFREVQNELKKVSWTTKDELMFCTKAVVYSTFLLSMGIYFIDLGVRGGLNILEIILKVVFR